MKQLCICYGNCQAVALSHIIKDIYSDIYDLLLLPPVHLMTSIDIEMFYECLQNDRLKLLIMQNISDNYKNNYLLSTKNILSCVKNAKNIIIIPVCYLDFYYPSISYIKTKNTYFNDINLMNLKHNDHEDHEDYNDHEDYKEKFIDIVNNEDFYSLEYLQNKFDNSIRELKSREKFTTIKISDYIEENYKDKLLFYTRNHPTGHIFKYIIFKLNTLLNLEIEIKDFNFYDRLNDKKFILYKSLNKILTFDIDNYNKTYVCLFNTLSMENVIDLMIKHIKDIKDIKDIKHIKDIKDI